MQKLDHDSYHYQTEQFFHEPLHFFNERNFFASSTSLSVKLSQRRRAVSKKLRIFTKISDNFLLSLHKIDNKQYKLEGVAPNLLTCGHLLVFSFFNLPFCVYSIRTLPRRSLFFIF